MIWVQLLYIVCMKLTLSFEGPFDAGEQRLHSEPLLDDQGTNPTNKDVADNNNSTALTVFTKSWSNSHCVAVLSPFAGNADKFLA